MASEHGTGSSIQLTPTSSVAGVTIEKELAELRSRETFLLTLHEHHRLEKLEELAAEQAQRAQDEQQAAAEDAEIEALKKKKNGWAFGLVDQLRLDELLNHQSRRRLKQAETQKHGLTSHSAPRTNTTESDASTMPQDLSIPSLLPNEQQSVATVLSLLSSQTKALEAQNKSLSAGLTKANGTIIKLETYHHALVTHARDDAKTKAILQAENHRLTKNTTAQQKTIEKMRARHEEAVEARLTETITAHERALENTRKDYEASITKLQADHKSAITSLQTTHEVAIAKLHNYYKATMSRLLVDYEAEDERLMKDIEDLSRKLQTEQTTRGEMVAQGICDGLRALVVSDVEETERVDDVGYAVVLPKGVVVETFDKMLSELRAANERTENFEQRVVCLEKDKATMEKDAHRHKDRIQELEKQLQGLTQERDEREPPPGESLKLVKLAEEGGPIEECVPDKECVVEELEAKDLERMRAFFTSLIRT